jgi:hypothetical protein
MTDTMPKIGCVQHDCRACEAHALQVSERISVYAADPPRTDWCGHMMRKRDKAKGFDTWCAYAATPEEAIRAVYEEFKRGKT